eukprot:TRINITY_DN25503_c0_g1_i1.p1 TRINITY_DN25503_c0_g1~~TRINITY_DN25503_c0_g1_i1.p1  ORF type:complete len:650 (+),score=104.49 TRINITY_DN25503_c0_g1_i1:93-2042(+)
MWCFPSPNRIPLRNDGGICHAMMIYFAAHQLGVDDTYLQVREAVDTSLCTCSADRKFRDAAKDVIALQATYVENYEDYKDASYSDIVTGKVGKPDIKGIKAKLGFWKTTTFKGDGVWDAVKKYLKDDMLPGVCIIGIHFGKAHAVGLHKCRDGDLHIYADPNHYEVSAYDLSTLLQAMSPRQFHEDFKWPLYPIPSIMRLKPIEVIVREVIAKVRLRQVRYDKKSKEVTVEIEQRWWDAHSHILTDSCYWEVRGGRPHYNEKVTGRVVDFKIDLEDDFNEFANVKIVPMANDNLVSNKLRFKAESSSSSDESSSDNESDDDNDKDTDNKNSNGMDIPPIATAPAGSGGGVLAYLAGLIALGAVAGILAWVCSRDDGTDSEDDKGDTMDRANATDRVRVTLPEPVQNIISRASPTFAREFRRQLRSDYAYNIMAGMQRFHHIAWPCFQLLAPELAWVPWMLAEEIGRHNGLGDVSEVVQAGIRLWVAGQLQYVTIITYASEIARHCYEMMHASPHYDGLLSWVPCDPCMRDRAVELGLFCGLSYLITCSVIGINATVVWIQGARAAVYLVARLLQRGIGSFLTDRLSRSWRRVLRTDAASVVLAILLMLASRTAPLTCLAVFGAMAYMEDTLPRRRPRAGRRNRGRGVHL